LVSDVHASADPWLIDKGVVVFEADVGGKKIPVEATDRPFDHRVFLPHVRHESGKFTKDEADMIISGSRTRTV